MLGINFQNCSLEFEKLILREFKDHETSVGGVLTFSNHEEVYFSFAFVKHEIRQAKSSIHFIRFNEKESSDLELDSKSVLQDRNNFRESWTYSGISFTPSGAEPTGPEEGAIGVPLVWYKTECSTQSFSKALFLDRDGVINVDKSYVSKYEDIEWVPGIVDLIQSANQKKLEVIVLTNQSGVARGYYEEEDVLNLHKQMDKWLKEKKAIVKSWKYSLFHNKGEVQNLKCNSYFRKPWPGMMLQAASEHNIELIGSYMIGDKVSDVLYISGPNFYLFKGNYDLQGTDAPVHDDLCKIIPLLEA
ncbi:MAG: HAD-IIIA family hydrolase [Bacteriovoracaceae bacterium]|nr:HAD-IIIA family hydrolase [Bacteriovoracaceae bacterium]